MIWVGAVTVLIFYGWTFKICLDIFFNLSLTRKLKLRIQQCSSRKSSVTNGDDGIRRLTPGADVSIRRDSWLRTKRRSCGTA